MTIEIVQAKTTARIEPNFEITILFSLLGLTLTLAVLGSSFGSLLALAG